MQWIGARLVRAMAGLALLACGAGCCPRPAALMPVLMLAGGEGHDFTALPARLAERLTGRGEMNVEVTQDLRRLEDPSVSRYRVLVFNTCQQAELSEAARGAILRHVRSGGGLVAMHGALWSYQDWPEWARLVGGFASSHDGCKLYECTVLDPQHAAMLAIGGRFTVTDEPCVIERLDPAANVLVRTSGPGRDSAGSPRNGPEPQVWTRREGEGRVFAAIFGHDERSQSDELIITLLHNGIRWAGGSLQDTRHNALTLAERQEQYELLFNGNDLAGWTGDTAHWTVENGELVGRAERLAHDMFVYTQKEYGDFVLKCSVRLRNHASGVRFRSAVFPESVLKGYQADVAAGRFGSLYEEGDTRRALAEGYKDKGETVAIADGWNEMVVEAVGPRIAITLNGLRTAEYEDKDAGARPARGAIGLQLAAGEAMEVRFRDIRIKSVTRQEP